VGRRCGDCDCGARGLRGLGGWIWGIRLQAPRGPALRVRDSVAAAATWLDIARYNDTGGISQRYTPGGGFYALPSDTKTGACALSPARSENMGIIIYMYISTICHMYIICMCFMFASCKFIIVRLAAMCTWWWWGGGGGVHLVLYVCRPAIRIYNIAYCMYIVH